MFEFEFKVTESRLKFPVCQSEVEMIVRAFILSRLKTSQDHLLRISSSKTSHDGTAALSSSLSLPRKFRVQLKGLVITFRALHAQIP